jgi:hypothetical protein
VQAALYIITTSKHLGLKIFLDYNVAYDGQLPFTPLPQATQEKNTPG